MLALLTVLSLTPSTAVMMTSFTRIRAVVVAHRARHRHRAAQCRQRLARAFLTVFVMGPALQSAYDSGIRRWSALRSRRGSI